VAETPDPDPGNAPRLGRWGARAYDALGHLGGLILAVMTAAVFFQVVTRYLGYAGFEGLDEVPRYLFVWLVMIGAAAAAHRGEHTALHYFRDRLTPRGQAFARVFTTAAAILLFLAMIKASLVLVPNAQLQRSAGLDLPLGYVYLAVPVGSALILLPLLADLMAALRDLRR
jgi:TRAP-type C4-dicarboxylate transport system permease small subunit